MTTWTITADDRDEQGDIKLADDTPLAAAPAPAPTPPAGRIAAFLPPLPKRATPAVTETTTPPRRGVIAGAVVAGLLLAAILIALISRDGEAAGQSGELAPRPSPLPATTPAPTATPYGAPIDGAMVAYFDPNDLTSATPLENGTRVVPVARIGHEWLQLRLADGAEPWVRWRDLPAPSASLDALPDLAPPTPAPTDVPPAPQPIYQAPAAPAPPATCDEATAPYRVTRRVELSGIPRGSITAWSCASQAEAEARANAQEAQLRATITAPATPAPTVAQLSLTYQATDQAVLRELHPPQDGAR
ncbi:MAG TPA: hypothetical protein VFO94_19320 [Gammaproteobacteria bacterium]|nr:hypothetical protein [Gammaproteobacteria bacterium]